jgi:hypothetical protein
MGPWNACLYEPAIGKAIWDLILPMTANASLPDSFRQIAILVVGARSTWHAKSMPTSPSPRKRQ